MSAFNTVTLSWPDPKSGRTMELRVQFKFGDTWQHEYREGDRLKWGGNDIGPQKARYVVVDGALEGMPPEGMGEDFEVHIRDGIIEKVVPASGNFDFLSSEHTYIVLED